MAGETATLAEARAFDMQVDAYLVAALSSPGDHPPAEPLTNRELQVLELLADGLSNKAIASRLAVSDETIKFHVSAIFGKLGVSNRTEAVRQAMRRCLVTV